MSNEIVTSNTSEYAVAQQSVDDLKEILVANLGEGAGLALGDLDEVKMPSGGGTSWEVPDMEAEDGTVSVKYIEGIICYWRTSRVYWEDEYTGGETEPDCRSFDGITGYGNPGGDCSTCPMAQFGTARRGGGQACTLKRKIYILRKDDILPITINFPSSSVGEVRKYFMRLSGRRMRYNNVISKLGLQKRVSGGGVDYSCVLPSFVSKLSPAEQEVVDAYSKYIGDADEAQVARWEAEVQNKIEDKPKDDVPF